MPETIDWDALCHRVDERPELLPLETVRCASWPAEVRLAPPRWVDALLAGRDVPALALCRRLIIVAQPLSKQQVVRVASSQYLRELDELRLFDVGLSDDDAMAFAAACRFEKLTSFCAPWNQLGPRGLRALVQSPAWQHLKRLHLYRNELGVEGIGVLTERAPALEYLNVCLNQLGAPGAEVVAGAARLRSLHTLHIGLNDFGDEGLVALGSSAHLGALRELNVKANGAGAAGLDALTQGPAWLSLERVLLEENRFGPEGAEVLASAPVGQVRTLQFGGAEVGATGARSLARAPALAKLQHLNLSGNRLTDEGLDAVITAPFSSGLSSLDVSDNGLSATGLEAARRLTHLRQLLARP
jgi:hypothetical protein